MHSASQSILNFKEYNIYLISMQHLSLLLLFIVYYRMPNVQQETAQSQKASCQSVSEPFRSNDGFMSNLDA